MAVDALVLKKHPVVEWRFRPAVSRSLVVRMAWPAIPRPVLRVLGTLHRLLLQASGGRLCATVRGGPVLLLTTTGRESGRSRTWPVCYMRIGDALVLAASAAGAPRQPGWYLNLRADPSVTIQLANRVQAMAARTAEGAERARLWERFVRRYPVCAGYQRQTARAIPVVVLTPLCSRTSGAGGQRTNVVHGRPPLQTGPRASAGAALGRRPHLDSAGPRDWVADAIRPVLTLMSGRRDTKSQVSRVSQDVRENFFGHVHTLGTAEVIRPLNNGVDDDRIGDAPRFGQQRRLLEAARVADHDVVPKR